MMMMMMMMMKMMMMMEVPKVEAQNEGMIVPAEVDEEVKPKQQVQFSLKYFFGKGEAKPVMTEVKKANRGRPSNHVLALKEAEEKGEQIMQLTKSELDEIVASQVQIAVKVGRMKNIDLEPGVSKRSNKRKLGEVIRRKEPNVATKLAIAEDVSAMLKSSCNEKEVKSRAMKKYGLTWQKLQNIVSNIEEWQNLVKQMKLSKMTGLKKQTASKFEKKHGVGCRRLGAGRVDKFKHVKVRLKAWLEKEREHGHFVDKSDLVIEFMEMCADESEACMEEMKKRKKQKEEAAEATIQAESVETTTAIVPAETATSSTAVEKKRGFFVEILPGFEGLQSPEEYVRTLNTEAELMSWRYELEQRSLKLACSEKY